MANNKQPHKTNEVPAKLLGAFYNLVASTPLFFIDVNYGMEEKDGKSFQFILNIS